MRDGGKVSKRQLQERIREQESAIAHNQMTIRTMGEDLVRLGGLLEQARNDVRLLLSISSVESIKVSVGLRAELMDRYNLNAIERPDDGAEED